MLKILGWMWLGSAACVLTFRLVALTAWDEMLGAVARWVR